MAIPLSSLVVVLALAGLYVGCVEASDTRTEEFLHSVVGADEAIVEEATRRDKDVYSIRVFRSTLADVAEPRYSVELFADGSATKTRFEEDPDSSATSSEIKLSGNFSPRKFTLLLSAVEWMRVSELDDAYYETDTHGGYGSVELLARGGGRLAFTETSSFDGLGHPMALWMAVYLAEGIASEISWVPAQGSR